MPSDLMMRFNQAKKEGLSDEAAMKKAMNTVASNRKKAKGKASERAKELGWVEKLKMASTKHIAKKYHSPAGRQHLSRKKLGIKE